MEDGGSEANAFGMIYEVGNCEIGNEIDTVVQSLYLVTRELQG